MFLEVQLCNCHDKILMGNALCVSSLLSPVVSRLSTSRDDQKLKVQASGFLVLG